MAMTCRAKILSLMSSRSWKLKARMPLFVSSRGMFLVGRPAVQEQCVSIIICEVMNPNK